MALLRRASSPARWARSHSHGAAALVLAAIVALMFRGAIFGGGVFFVRDVGMVWYPQATVVVHCLAMGSWPFWDPYRGFGQPLLADPSAQVLYPPAWLRLLIEPATCYTTFLVLHYLFSAVGMFLLARRLGVSRGGAMLAGAVWVSCGPMLSLTSLYHHLASAAWMPWLAWCLDRVAARRTGGNLARLVLVAALQILGGSADMVLLSWLAGLTLLLVRSCARRGDDPAGLRRTFGFTALGIVCAACVTCAMWLPALASTRNAARRDLDAQARGTWSLHPLSLIEMGLRFRWAQAPAIRWDLAARKDMQAPWLPSVYFGLPALALVAAGSARRTRVGRALAGLAVFSLLVALGRHGFVYEWLAELVPLLRMLRFPVKALLLTSFCVALLAGLGVDAWSRVRVCRGMRWRLWMCGPLLGISVLCLVGLAWGRWSAASSSWQTALRAATQERAWLLAGAGMAAGLAALAWLAGRRSSAYWGLAVGVLAVVDLLSAQHDVVQLAPADVYRFAPPALDVIDRARLDRVYVDDYAIERRGWRGRNPYELLRGPKGWDQPPARLLGVYLYMNPPTNERWRVCGSYDYDLLGLQPTVQASFTRFLRDDADPEQQLRLLQFGAVTHALSMQRAAWWEKLIPLAHYEGLFVAPMHLFAVPNTLGRAYVADGTQVADDEHVLARLLDPTFDPRRSVVVSSGVSRAPGPTAAGSARIVSYAPDRVVLEIEAARAATAVLADAYDAGWNASLDGAPAAVMRVDGIFRGVAVAPGRHRLEFVYRPKEILVGCAVSVGGLVLTIALGWWFARRGGSPAEPASRVGVVARSGLTALARSR